jgi:hypothetical protein
MLFRLLQKYFIIPTRSFGVLNKLNTIFYKQCQSKSLLVAIDICDWLFVIGYWLLVICDWLFVIGYWLLVICDWLLEMTTDN